MFLKTLDNASDHFNPTKKVLIRIDFCHGINTDCSAKYKLSHVRSRSNNVLNIQAHHPVYDGYQQPYLEVSGS